MIDIQQSAHAYSTQQDIVQTEEDRVLSFREDVLAGLKSHPKHLSSKYFYDAKGDALFQQIMNCSEYYLTRCELEIFRDQTSSLINAISNATSQSFDLIELGVGDGIKSKYLIRELLDRRIEFTYLPVDISGNILSHLETSLSDLQGLNLVSLEGEYFDMLREATKISGNRKVILFLGANIGNMSANEAQAFCKDLRSMLQPGDVVLMGFDLKKNPHTILEAYNDKGGITRDFNLNLLKRINTELEGNFNLHQFTHYQTYDPETGACKSYLVSNIKQTVIVDGTSISFSEGEWIYMEVSQKYSPNEIEKLASHSGFSIITNFTDSKRWFIDSVWTAQ
jgi:dimethylhistidine N-methyltransferase